MKVFILYHYFITKTDLFQIFVLLSKSKLLALC
uniref:Repressor protein n=1 Tax=Siphoviridae sp. ctHip2 TaxID=2827830 RepID=A0A8S5RVS5_9CAUD|nr:MAG TPA: repressor protein [Siphoviridae sp. ctHip2]